MEPAYGKINLSSAEVLYGVLKTDEKSFVKLVSSLAKTLYLLV